MKFYDTEVKINNFAHLSTAVLIKSINFFASLAYAPKLIIFLPMFANKFRIIQCENKKALKIRHTSTRLVL